MLETTITVLDGLGAFPAVIQRELGRYLPFLATTKLLLAAVAGGSGREEAHEVIKEHAVAAALAMREDEGADTDLVARLAADARYPWARPRSGPRSRRQITGSPPIRSPLWLRPSISLLSVTRARRNTARPRSCDRRAAAPVLGQGA